MLLFRAHHALADAEAALASAGLSCTPFAISQTEPTSVRLPQSGHIILTSQAAIPALPQEGAFTIHTVNTTTATAVQKAIKGTNHKIGIVGSQDAAALAKEILTAHTPPELFHHLTTSQAQTEWYKPLIEVGHGVQRHQAYATHYVENLTKDAAHSLESGNDMILCSKRSAEHLLFLSKRANISLAECTAYCLSSAIAETIKEHVTETISSKVPTFSALIETIQERTPT